MLRLITWSLAIGLLVVILELDREPADPAPSAEHGQASRATVVVPWTQLPEIRPVDDPPANTAWDVQIPHRWLIACTAAPQPMRQLTGLVQALASAADHTLDEPGQFEINVTKPLSGVSFYSGPDRDSSTLSVVYPAGDPPVAELFERDWNRSRLLRTDGSFLAVGSRSGHERLGEVWRVCRHGRWKDSVYVPAHALNPEQHPGRSEILRRYLRAFGGDVDVQSTRHGLLVSGDGLEAAQQLLDDPRLIALAWELSTRPPDMQASIRRTALCDDDPHLAEFAALDQMWLLPQPEAKSLEMLASWPHPVPARQTDDFAPQTLWFDDLAPQAAARTMQRLARTTVDADQLADAFFHMLSAESSEKRRVGQIAFLERLPRRALAELDHLASPISWNHAERDTFYNALLDRLCSELAHGDAPRAAQVLGEATNLTDPFNLTDYYPAYTRFLELVAQLLFDDTLGDLIQHHGGDRIVDAAHERLRDSDPEIRRRAYLLLKARNAHQDAPRVLAGDPYLEDLVSWSAH